MDTKNAFYRSVGLSSSEEKNLAELLMFSPHIPPGQEDVWFLMDKIWDEMGCDNLLPDSEKLARFYSHPVWLLSGLFIENDALSMQHRHAICDWITLEANSLNLSKVLDYGGGFATFGRLLAEKNTSIRIDVLEPHPTDLARRRVSNFNNLNFLDQSSGIYDALVSIDVLEHVTDPLQTLEEMISLVRVGGILILANCFYPFIKCHLPNTFHLRYTFDFFAKWFGLEKIGPCQGSHATIYIKRKDVPHFRIMLGLYKRVSKSLFPALDSTERFLRKIWSFSHCE